jgi:hypothetical protein
VPDREQRDRQRQEQRHQAEQTPSKIVVRLAGQKLQVSVAVERCCFP